MRSHDELAAQIMHRLHALAACSERDDCLTRRYLTPAHKSALAQIRNWMLSAGMTVRVDGAANLIGTYAGRVPGTPALALGSHVDTVTDGGKYDGALGIVLPIVCVEALHEVGHRFDFPIEIIAFGDEEGVRFQSTYLGSRALAGNFDLTLLEREDTDGITMSRALRDFGITDPIDSAAYADGSVGAYLEVHIEQGPVLEAEALPVGIVTAIAGATRLAVALSGEAGHAGTVPMSLRKDALAGAAEAVSLVESTCRNPGLVGTVGMLAAAPGAVNVIPGRVQFSVDVRAADDAIRERAVAELKRGFAALANARGLTVELDTTHDASAVSCDEALSAVVAQAVSEAGYTPRHLPSGAGHDAAAMATLAPVAMLFVRCLRGISHHPDESIDAGDVAAAVAVTLRFCHLFQDRGHVQAANF